MRRKDRQMPESFGWEIIDRCAFATLCLTEESGEPYGVSLSPARLGGRAVYFHCARQGRKNDLIARAGRVCCLFVGGVEQTLADGSHLGYESAVAFGHIAPVTDRKEKTEAMVALSLRYTPEKGERREYIAKFLDALEVYRLDIEELTAKRKLLDADGKPLVYRQEK